MPEGPRRTQVRDHNGPMPIDRSRHSSRRHRDSETRDERSVVSPRRRPSTRQKDFVLQWMAQPPSAAAVDHVVDSPIAVMVSLHPNSPHASKSRPFDPKNLTAIPTLLSESTGMTMPSGVLAVLPGQSASYAVHEFEAQSEQDYVKRKVPRELRSYVLGYASFPDLIVRVPGTYRIRVTLVSASGALVEAVDSEPIRVGRFNGDDESD